MKAAAALLLLVASVLTGKCVLNSLNLSEKAIDELIFIVDELISAVRFSKKSVQCLFAELAHTSDFAAACIGEMKDSDNIHIAWTRAVNSEYGSRLDAQTKESLLTLGEQIGKNDCDRELLLLEGYRKRFCNRAEALRVENAEKKRLYTAASWLIGAFLAVLVI